MVSQQCAPFPQSLLPGLGKTLVRVCLGKTLGRVFLDRTLERVWASSQQGPGSTRVKARGAESPLPGILALAICGVLLVEALERELAKASPEPDLDILLVVVEVLLAEVGGGLDELFFGQLAGLGERRVSYGSPA